MNEDSPLVQYIQQLENPKREGYSILTERWYRPQRKGFDSQQYGYGLDKNTNYGNYDIICNSRRSTIHGLARICRSKL